MALWLYAVVMVGALAGCVPHSAKVTAAQENQQLSGEDMVGEGAPDQLEQSQANVTKAVEVKF